MASNTLEKLGYTVIQAANGNEALEHFHADTGRCIDLLLSDVIMPELSGRELAGRIRVIYPEYPILFMTGYTEKLQDGRLDGIELLSKPFSAAELSDRVRQVLDS